MGQPFWRGVKVTTTAVVADHTTGTAAPGNVPGTMQLPQAHTCPTMPLVTGVKQATQV